MNENDEVTIRLTLCGVAGKEQEIKAINRITKSNKERIL